MSQTSMPSYIEIDQALSETTLKLHPSEVHGIICGVLCGNPKNKLEWEKLVTGGEDTTKIHELLQTLFIASTKELDEFLFEFQLLLPGDEDELSIRAEALTLWCQGYLAGLKLAGIVVEGREASDVTEAIDDIIEIAKMNYEDVVASDEDEAAYIERVEYVRMAAVLVYQDTHEQNVVEGASALFKHLH